MTYTIQLNRVAAQPLAIDVAKLRTDVFYLLKANGSSR
jgi:hypothetical protein